MAIDNEDLKKIHRGEALEALKQCSGYKVLINEIIFRNWYF